MEINTLQRDVLLNAIDKMAFRITDVIEMFTPDTINQVPFKGSWTAAQVTDHVTMSNASVVRALGLTGTAGNRNPAERVTELEGIFLNFTTQLKSPDFILPTSDEYDKETVVAALTTCLAAIEEAAEQCKLEELITHPAFGDITKYEILHFALFHTQRHIHQLENIYGRIENP